MRKLEVEMKAWGNLGNKAEFQPRVEHVLLAETFLSLSTYQFSRYQYGVPFIFPVMRHSSSLAIVPLPVPREAILIEHGRLGISPVVVCSHTVTTRNF